ncbi:MAG: hypothetical protein A3F54_02515 [Candidatus Kerfeldbacteria bacterium RIFCSPHIGHO2_12_FULL_48_17]|uniref:HMA domain-containing protein n=1 Tax=Candidatus Kerfeldbacteria bacterium RIFCSPHIGHO2_12_FULL_48_17 TaxID=1798542 RepID=A0A1G2AZU2_9BACT|nr:MAG: hypothetical protein A3F54_02515 [Candidatus Kerfeldbacteria bacterium RIFCSPHIGHO2_12_FULL_48_17]
MNEFSQIHIYKFRVSALTNKERADELQKLLQNSHGIEKIDINTTKRVMRLVASGEIDVKQLGVKLAAHRFHLERLPLPADAYQPAQRAADVRHAPTKTSENKGVVNVCVDGMTCRSCEITIERQWKKLPGVAKVEVNAGTGKASLNIEGQRPSIAELQAALSDDKYRVYENNKKRHGKSAAAPVIPEGRPSLARLVGLVASVLFIGYLLSRLGLFNVNIDFGSRMSFATVFVIGLVAAASSCIAVAGGLLLSSTARFNQKYHSASRMARFRPVMMFVIGRVLGYGFFGGLLGVIGRAIVPSPLVTGLLIILAAFYMFIMGMEMLHLAPPWLKRLLPRMPKRLSHSIMDKESNSHPLAPFFLGAATFFLPCGFTQALQLYALTTGSFTTAAFTLLVFALGTAPSLLALGWASGSLKGKAGKWFFQFSGALVMVLGVWNFQNGLNLIGYPLSLGRGNGASASATAQASATVGAEGSAGQTGDVQVVTMKANPSGYSPDRLTVKAGIPVRWEIDGTNAKGCISVLVSRQLGIQEPLKPGKNVFEFTPTGAGEIAFSCSMGMYRGSFTVLPAS